MVNDDDVFNQLPLRNVLDEEQAREAVLDPSAKVPDNECLYVFITVSGCIDVVETRGDVWLIEEPTLALEIKQLLSRRTKVDTRDCTDLRLAQIAPRLMRRKYCTDEDGWPFSAECPKLTKE